MSDEVLNHVIEMKATLAANTAKLDLLMGWAKTHTEEDKKIAADLHSLQLSHARQRGATKVLAVMATAVSSVIGALVSHWFTTKAH